MLNDEWLPGFIIQHSSFIIHSYELTFLHSLSVIRDHAISLFHAARDLESSFAHGTRRHGVPVHMFRGIDDGYFSVDDRSGRKPDFRLLLELRVRPRSLERSEER